MEPAIGGGVTTVAQEVNEDFENVLDVPFVTVNRINGRYFAEVIASEDDTVTKARIQQALDVGHTKGVHAFAGKHGTYNNILIYFTPDHMEAAA